MADTHNTKDGLEFVGKYVNRLNTQNYNQVKLTFGHQLEENIFDPRFNKDIYDKLKTYFIHVKDSSIQELINKIYYKSNKELHINNSFQQRVYNNKLYDYKVTPKNPKCNLDIKYTFYEKKMISIENFPTKQEYDNIIIKKTTSINIKNKYYVNFSEIINESTIKNVCTKSSTNKKIVCNPIYNITILIKRKTNLLSSLQETIDQINQIIKLHS